MTSTNTNGIKETILDENAAQVTVSRSKFGRYRRANQSLIARLGGSLPELVTEGSVPIFPPTEAERRMDSLIRATVREISRYGVKRSGGGTSFIVPVTKVDVVQQLLDATAPKFAACVAEIERDYDRTFDLYVTNVENGYTDSSGKRHLPSPEGAMVVREMRVDRQLAISKYNFEGEITSYAPLNREGRDRAKDVASMVAGLSRQLFNEVSEAMVELLESDSIVRGKAGQKTLRPIKSALEKLQGFLFVDPRMVKGCIDFIEAVIATLPQNGWIEDKGSDTPFTTLKKLVETLADEDKLLDAASRVANGIKAADVLFPPKPQLKPAPVPVAKAPVATPSVQPAAYPGMAKPTVVVSGAVPARTAGLLMGIPRSNVPPSPGRVTLARLF